MTKPTTIFYAHLKHYTDSLIHYLPESEKKRANTLAPARRKQFILGRASLFVALQQLTGRGDFAISYQDGGKPMLKSPTPWFFNLTHSGQHLLLAVQKHQAIGIDCEQLRARNYQRVAKKYFGQKIEREIQQAEEPLNCFYSYWTRYEAYIKYHGLSVFASSMANSSSNLSTFCYKQLIFSLCNPCCEEIDFIYSVDFECKNILKKECTASKKHLNKLSL